MTWSDPITLSALFDTDDIPTQSNFDSLFLDLASVPHPLEAPTAGDLDVVSLNTEQTFYSVTVPANSMGTNGRVQMFTAGDIRGVGSGVHVLTVRMKYGGSTLVTYTSDFGAVSTRKRFLVEWNIVNQAATNAQLCWANIEGSGITTSSTSTATASADTTSDQTAAITVQWTNADANNSVRRQWAFTSVAQN